MRRPFFSRASIATAIAVAALCSTVLVATVAADTPIAASEALITAEQATAAALERFPGATVTEVELEEEDGTLLYSIDLVDTAGKLWGVEVDATTGEILEVEEEDAQDADDADEGDEGDEGDDAAGNAD